MRGFRRQGAETHVATPVVENLPLSLIDAAGVVGEDGLQGVGHALVGGPQGRQGCRFPEDGLGAGGEVKVFGLSESQIARRVKVIAKAAGLADWESFSGHSGRVGMARRMAQNGAPTHEIERQGRWKQGGGMVGRYTRGESAGSALRYL